MCKQLLEIANTPVLFTELLPDFPPEENFRGEKINIFVSGGHLYVQQARRQTIIEFLSAKSFPHINLTLVYLCFFY